MSASRTTTAGSAGPPAGLRPASQRAQDLTGRPYLSYSQVAMMRACPKKFELHYVRRAAAEHVPASLVFGAAIHEVTEAHFRAMLAGGSLSAGDLHDAYRRAWQAQKAAAGGTPLRYAATQDEGMLEEMALHMLEAFLRSPAASMPGVLLGIEEEFTVTVARNLPDVLARVDLIYETADALVVRDLKTSRSPWRPEQAEDSAEQLFLYARVLQNLGRARAKPVTGEFVVLTKQKNPQVQILPVPLTPEAIGRTCAGIVTTWKAVLAGHFYPCPSPRNCTSCPYKRHCPAFGGQ